jgi:hypothetical protein
VTKHKHRIGISDPVGPDNDDHLIDMAKQAAIVIFAYGNTPFGNAASIVALFLIEKAHLEALISSSCA